MPLLPDGVGPSRLIHSEKLTRAAQKRAKIFSILREVIWFYQEVFIAPAASLNFG